MKSPKERQILRLEDWKNVQYSHEVGSFIFLDVVLTTPSPYDLRTQLKSNRTLPMTDQNTLAPAETPKE